MNIQNNFLNFLLSFLVNIVIIVFSLIVIHVMLIK